MVSSLHHGYLPARATDSGGRSQSSFLDETFFGVPELLGQLLAETWNDFVNFFHFTEKDLLGFYLIRN